VLVCLAGRLQPDPPRQVLGVSSPLSRLGGNR
jgi:hypothetical protein